VAPRRSESRREHFRKWEKVANKFSIAGGGYPPPTLRSRRA